MSTRLQLNRQAFLLLILAAANAYGQATLNTYTDKAAFLAATGAASATGPLPNLGQVNNATVGSLSFRPTSVDDTLYIGAQGTPAAPDWYPPRPGNEIAMSRLHLTVQAAAPIYSVGFEFVEPPDTVQATYVVILF